jgi:hypothetical protein
VDSRKRDRQLSILESADITGLEVWLRFLHGTMNKKYRKVKVVDLFNIIEAADYYFFQLDKLNEWFREWFAECAPIDISLIDIKDMPWKLKEL